MKSGLYACAGASATASAAAWAKRFEEPITNESNVYFALKPPLSGRGDSGWPTTGPRGARPPPPAAGPPRPLPLAVAGRAFARRELDHAQLDRPLHAGHVADRRADQPEEVP